MHRLLRALLPVLLVGLSGFVSTVQAQALTISAAASLGPAMSEIGRSFEAARPGVQLRFNFAASGVLVQQLEHGAPVDVLACADQASMDRAQQQQLIQAGSRRDFTANQLVLIAPLQDDFKINQLADLSRAEVQRIAIGKPASVPAGQYATLALQAAQLWLPLTPKFVQADNVRQVLAYVARGEVQAGFVYRSDALAMGSKVRLVQPVGGTVLYPVAVTRGTAQTALAQDFIRYLQGAAAQQILLQQGFASP